MIYPIPVDSRATGQQDNQSKPTSWFRDGRYPQYPSEMSAHRSYPSIQPQYLCSIPSIIPSPIPKPCASRHKQIPPIPLIHRTQEIPLRANPPRHTRIRTPTATATGTPNPRAQSRDDGGCVGTGDANPDEISLRWRRGGRGDL